MQREDYLKRNIKTLLENLEPDECKGASFIQRACCVGYNQAMHTIEYGVKTGSLVMDEDRPYLFRAQNKE